MKITAHVLVKNEERFLWFSFMSAANYFDEIILWDNGSTDGTNEVIEQILKVEGLKNKIKFKLVEKSFVDEDEIRQSMLDVSTGDWIFVLDGDEIWWEDSIKQIVETIQKEGKYLDSIVVPTVNLVSDIYHKMEENAGKYHLAGRVGHLNLRAFSMAIPGIASSGKEWEWGWVDEGGKMIQDRDPQKIKYLEAPYLHATHLQRSGKEGEDQKAYRRGAKKKYEIGENLSKDYYYPEALFRPRPVTIPSPWKKMDTKFFVRSFFETPFRKLKRRIL